MREGFLLNACLSTSCFSPSGCWKRIQTNKALSYSLRTFSSVSGLPHLREQLQRKFKHKPACVVRTYWHIPSRYVHRINYSSNQLLRDKFFIAGEREETGDETVEKDFASQRCRTVTPRIQYEVCLGWSKRCPILRAFLDAEKMPSIPDAENMVCIFCDVCE